MTFLSARAKAHRGRNHSKHPPHSIRLSTWTGLRRGGKTPAALVEYHQLGAAPQTPSLISDRRPAGRRGWRRGRKAVRGRSTGPATVRAGGK